LDVVAPGEPILSTVPGGTWNTKSGTSMAAPFVSGIAALFVARNPGSKAWEFEPWIRSHVTPIAPALHAGAGLVNFDQLADWRDAPGFTAVRHKNFLWEWLGSEATNELSE